MEKTVSGFVEDTVVKKRDKIPAQMQLRG